MSESYILEYAGAAVMFPSPGQGLTLLVVEEDATHFASEGAAWDAAAQYNLSLALCRVVDLTQRYMAANASCAATGK